MVLKIGSSGCKYHSMQLVQQFNQRGIDAKFIDLPTRGRTSGRVIVIGQFPFDLQFMEEHLNDSSVDIYPLFVGTDVIALNEAGIECVQKGATKALCVADHLKEELKEREIEAETVTLTPEPIFTAGEPIYPLPEEFSVLCYLPRDREPFFQLHLVVDTALSLPDIKFYIYGGSPYPTRDNIENLGWLDQEQKKDLYRKVSCGFRVPVHDGWPQSLIEMAQIGRVTVHKEHKFPYMVKIELPSDDVKGHIKTTLMAVRDQLPSQEEQLKEMAAHYRETFTVDKMINRFREVLEL